MFLRVFRTSVGFVHSSTCRPAVDSVSAPNARCTMVHTCGVNGALIAGGGDRRKSRQIHELVH